MKPNPKILIGTLYSGENEINQCLQSVKNQNYKNWEQKIFKNLGKQEAQVTLYKFFMSKNKEFDLFVKMDADMVFAQNDILEKIISIFRKEKNLDHLVIAVEDYVSGTNIMGMHAFSSNCRWGESRDNLFTDYNPKFTGKKLKIENPKNLKIQHSPNPSDFQAFRFGVHRAQKAFQFGRLKIKKEQMEFHWSLLNNFWSNYKKKRDKKMGLALMGAEAVISKKIKGNINNYQEAKIIQKIFKKIKDLKEEEIYNFLKKRWGNKTIVKTRRFLKIYKQLLLLWIIKIKNFRKN